MGKTWKDDKVINRHKKGARLATLDADLRTRVKPVDKRVKGGGKNKTRDIIEEAFVLDQDDEDFLAHFEER